jgi:hypothetical protein
MTAPRTLLKRRNLEKRAEAVHLRLVRLSKRDPYAPRDSDGRQFTWTFVAGGYQPTHGFHTLADANRFLEMTEIAVESARM